MTSPHRYPDALAVRPFAGPVRARVRVPGSKSITNRALVLAALGAPPGGTTLSGALRSEDTEVMVDGLRRLGFAVDVEWDAGVLRVRRPTGAGRRIPATGADLFVANSGTTMRFLSAAVALGDGTYRLDGVPRMRERPIGDLLAALRQLGVDAVSEAGTDCPPVRIHASGLPGGDVGIRAGLSSQFLSGLLMAAPFAAGDLTIRVQGETVSEPYIDMTVKMLADWGVAVEASEPGVYRVPRTPGASRPDYAVEPDASAASYFFAAAAITGGTVTVRGMHRGMLQGDVAFVDLLARMGCAVGEEEDGITVRGGPLRGIDCNMNAISDTVMTLAAVACFAEGPTVIRDVAHVRHKETDRIAAVANELRKLGASVEERSDGLTIAPGELHGAAVDTYNDHRMAMSLALVGLRVPGVIVNDPGCVAKTYPAFWQDLERLRGAAG